MKMWPKLRWTRDRLGIYLLVCRIGKFHASIFKHEDGLYHAGSIWDVIARDGSEYRLGASAKTKLLRDAKEACAKQYLMLMKAAFELETSILANIEADGTPKAKKNTTIKPKKGKEA